MEFYLTFWPLIKNDFKELINHIFFEKKELLESMKTEIISMILKKDPNDTDIAKWKTISLLWVHYKIITKALTNQLLHTLDEIISIEQSAAAPNRTIYNNLLTTRDRTKYKSLSSALKALKISGHLLLKNSEDPLLSSCVSELQTGAWKVEDTVLSCESDKNFNKICGAYTTTTKISKNKSPKSYRKYISDNH